jgi:hypothetical protein
MSTQSVNAAILSPTLTVTYPVRYSSRLWESLTFSSFSGTLLKVAAVVVISGLIRFILRAYWERSRGSNIPKTSDGSGSSPVVEISKNPPQEPLQAQASQSISNIKILPDGIQQHHMDEARKVFIEHVKLHRKSIPIPAEVKIDITTVRDKLTKGLRTDNCFFDYLIVEKIITSYMSDDYDFTVSLTEPYLESLKSDPATILKAPPQKAAFLDYVNNNKRKAGRGGHHFEDDVCVTVIEEGKEYAHMGSQELDKFGQGTSKDTDWLDYMVQEKLITGWYITLRNRECYVWL